MDHSGNTTAPLEALETPYQTFLICLYSLTALFAFISNAITIIVLLKGRRCTRDLRKFLINLSVTDILMAFLTIPFTYTNYMFGRWVFGVVMCPLVNFAQLTTITVSIYTLIAIAIDRYIAILYPLKKSISWFNTHRNWIVLFIWAFGVSIGFSQLLVSETSNFVHNGVTYMSCGERWPPESSAGQLYTAFIFGATFAMPMIALCVVYTVMGCKLIRYRVPGQPSTQRQQQKKRQQQLPLTSYRKSSTEIEAFEHNQATAVTMLNGVRRLSENDASDSKNFYPLQTTSTSNAMNDKQNRNFSIISHDRVTIPVNVDRNRKAKYLKTKRANFVTNRDLFKINFIISIVKKRNSCGNTSVEITDCNEDNDDDDDGGGEAKLEIKSAQCDFQHDSAVTEDRLMEKSCQLASNDNNNNNNNNNNNISNNNNHNHHHHHHHHHSTLQDNNDEKTQVKLITTTFGNFIPSVNKKIEKLDIEDNFTQINKNDNYWNDCNLKHHKEQQQQQQKQQRHCNHCHRHHNQMQHYNQQFTYSNSSNNNNNNHQNSRFSWHNLSRKYRKNLSKSSDDISQCQMQNSNSISQKIISVRRNKVLTMLVTIIGVFTACWLPIQLFNILIYFKPNFLSVDSPLKYYTFVGSYFFCHWISMAHSFMNPIIYSFMSKNFKEDIRYVFQRYWNSYVKRREFRLSYSSKCAIYKQRQHRHSILHNSIFAQSNITPSRTRVCGRETKSQIEQSPSPNSNIDSALQRPPPQNSLTKKEFCVNQSTCKREMNLPVENCITSYHATKHRRHSVDDSANKFEILNEINQAINISTFQAGFVDPGSSI